MGLLFFWAVVMMRVSGRRGGGDGGGGIDVIHSVFVGSVLVMCQQFLISMTYLNQRIYRTALAHLLTARLLYATCSAAHIYSERTNDDLC